ncbi:MAG: sulfite exporter TauE/SafE family protein [Proteobacteria bacterium]|nr:sulfite exporter TauE/SafE family protein [Pseudomonadota bacterium]
MITSRLAVALLVTLAAGAMRGFSGFGNALVMAPTLSVLYGPAVAVPTVLLVEMVIAAQLVPGALGEARWRDLALLGGPACLAAPFGGYLLVALDPRVVQVAIGATVAAFSLAMLAGWRFSGRRTPAASALVGATSGLMIGVTSVAGPPVILYLLSGRDPPRLSRATLIVFFGLVTAATYPMLILNGLIGERVLWLAAMLAPTLALGVWGGSRLFRSASETLYRRIALVFLFAVALVAIAG